MGRWAQRRRAGGGPSTAPTQIILAQLSGTDFVELTYNRTVNVADFSELNFTTNTAVTAVGVGQTATNKLIVDFGEDISGAGSLTYTGTTPAVISPQTIAIV